MNFRISMIADRHAKYACRHILSKHSTAKLDQFFVVDPFEIEETKPSNLIFHILSAPGTT